MLSFRTVRHALAVLFALMALAAWFAPMPGADGRMRALLCGLMLAGALVGSPLSDYLSMVPTGRR